MQVHETVVTNFSGVQTLSHLVGGQKNFTTNFHVHVYATMAITTTTGDINKREGLYLERKDE